MMARALAVIVAAATWDSASGMTLPSPLKTMGSRHLGTTAALDDVGYQQILATGSDADLTAFVARVLDSEQVSLEGHVIDDMIKSLRQSTSQTFAQLKLKMEAMVMAFEQKVGGSHKKEAPAVPTAHQTWHKKEALAPVASNKKEASSKPASRKSLNDEMDDLEKKISESEASAGPASHKKVKHAVSHEMETTDASAKTNVTAHPHGWDCPTGFEYSEKNLQGSSGLKYIEAMESPEECARQCCEHEGCTSFETGTTTKYKGCWIYFGGDADIKFKSQDPDWISCIKKPDPDACSAFACPHGYKHLVKNLQGGSGLKQDLYDADSCAAVCCARDGCTSFEFGPTTKYAGCWTYTDGEADIKFKDQLENWTSCVRDGAPDCTTTTTTPAATTTEAAVATTQAAVVTTAQPAVAAATTQPAASGPSPCPPGYDYTVKNLQGSSGLKEELFDAESCAAVCCARDGCTSFEFGPTTKYAGCWTYTDGTADVKFSGQIAEWTSCMRTTAPNCPAGAAPAPAPAPVAPSGSGDPHLVNTRGERFDIYKTGLLEFLRVPYESPTKTANFTVFAKVQTVKDTISQCDQKLYITSMLLDGAWFEGWPLEVSMHNGQMLVQRAGAQVKSAPETRHIGKMVQFHLPDANNLHVGVGGTWIDVSRDLQPVHYFLNMQARSLRLLDCKIGGLLGEDDHVEVSKPPAGCEKTAVSSLTARRARHAQASAEM